MVEEPIQVSKNNLQGWSYKYDKVFDQHIFILTDSL